MGVLNIHIHPIWESTVAQASRHWQCLKVEIPFAKLQPAFSHQPCVGHRVGFEPRGSQEHSWAAPSVRVLIQGKRELGSTPLSPAGVGAWGVVAYADFRAWYGFHLLSRNLQSLVWNVSVHLQTALAEDGESCLLHVPHPAPLGLQSRAQSDNPRTMQVIWQPPYLWAALPSFPLACAFRQWRLELGLLQLSQCMPVWKRARFCLLRDLCSF